MAALDPAERQEPVTYVVDEQGALLLAPRRSEHVDCAGGADVLVAGEIGFVQDDTGTGWSVGEVSNQSTGYCPSPGCWPAVAAALDAAGIAHPDGFTHAFVFRRCEPCRQLTIVKDDDYTCALCGSDLARRSSAAVIDLPVPPDTRAGQLAASIRPADNSAFLDAVTDSTLTFHHRSTRTLLAAGPEEGFDAVPVLEPTWSLLLRAVHQSFAAHLPLSLSPDLLWYAVVHEVAVHVQLNSEQYAGIFTDTPAHRQTITVRDDSLLDSEPDWSRSIRLVQEPLRAKLGSDLADLLLPQFSTTTPEDVSSALVALMSVVSPYYRFEWESLCGIPRIRLEGQASDWRLLATRVRALGEWFDGLESWFQALGPVLDEIAATAAGGTVDTEFWRSLYKWQSMSGGEFVSGWITVFFAHTQTPSGPQPKQSFGWSRGERFRENAFPSHISLVPFEWHCPDGAREMRFLAGVLGIELDGEYVRPLLGHAVAERRAAAPHPEDHLLPDGWTHTRLRRVAGFSAAQALSADRAVWRPAPDDGPSQRFRPTHVVQLALCCLVRAADSGLWYAGSLHPDTGEIHCTTSHGPDLAQAIEDF